MSHEADGAISHGPALDDADRLMLAIGAGGLDVAVAMGGGPFYLQCPKVLGVKLTGTLPGGATATDLVLTITERLRKHGDDNLS